MYNPLRLNKYRLCGQMSVGYDRICPMTLNIYEIDYSVSPGGINVFEVYDETDQYITDFDNMVDAHNWCNAMKENYTVHLLSTYHREFEEDLYETPANT
jgi:hypothetical protein